jgi:hypothetical protein
VANVYIENEPGAKKIIFLMVGPKGMDLCYKSGSNLPVKTFTVCRISRLRVFEPLNKEERCIRAFAKASFCLWL